MGLSGMHTPTFWPSVSEGVRQLQVIESSRQVWRTETCQIPSRYLLGEKVTYYILPRRPSKDNPNSVEGTITVYLLRVPFLLFCQRVAMPFAVASGATPPRTPHRIRRGSGQS